MRRLLILLILCLGILSLTPVQAQTPMEKVLTQVDASQGLEVYFSLEGQLSAKQEEGVYYAMGKQFYMESPILTAWYNGKDLWVYVLQNGEINLSNPTEEELAEINPLTNLALMQSKKMKVTHKSIPGGILFTAVPKLGYQGSLTRITVKVDNQYKPTLLTVHDRGSETPLTVTISKIKKGIPHPSSLFTFDNSKAPGVTVVDLR